MDEGKEERRRGGMEEGEEAMRDEGRKKVGGMEGWKDSEMQDGGWKDGWISGYMERCKDVEMEV